MSEMITSKLARRIPMPDQLPPVDDQCLLTELAVDKGLNDDALRDTVREHFNKIDQLYRSIGGSGLACSDIFEFQCAEQDRSLVRISLYALESGEEMLLKLLSERLEDSQKPEPNYSNLPITDDPQYNLNEEQFKAMLANSSGLEEIFGLIRQREEEMK